MKETLTTNIPEEITEVLDLHTKIISRKFLNIVVSSTLLSSGSAAITNLLIELSTQPVTPNYELTALITLFTTLGSYTEKIYNERKINQLQNELNERLQPITKQKRKNENRTLQLTDDGELIDGLNETDLYLHNHR